jgi:hypothetical protein
VLAVLVSHGMGVLAYSMLSPVIVGYAVLVFGVVAFGLLGAGIEQDGSLVQNVVFAVLAVGDGALVDWMWRPELSMEENALRLFGTLGVVLWVGELVLSPFREPDEGDPPSFWVRFRSFFTRMALFTASLSFLLLVAVLLTQARVVGLTPGFVLQAAFTSIAMGAVLLLFTAPTLAVWFTLQAARRPVAALIAGDLSLDDPWLRGAPPSHGARSAGVPRPPAPRP